ncbi:MAG: HAD family hydrolase [Bacteroidales bacterium]|nr:HAD family hydrolase [Bacteroidales bacterium]MBP5757821.1 HAD family hydrolase [Bacteroidales bacterium]
MKKLVIFDLDGTLVNTIADLADSVNHALQTLGYPAQPYEKFPYFVGNGIYKLIERALPPESRDEQTIRSVKAVFMDYYMLHNTDKSTVYEGVGELLRALADKGVALAVASNKVHEATVAMIARLFPGIGFACVLGQRDGVPTKPNPAIVAEILKTASATPTETLYVGDSGVDMQTAHNAGITAVGVTWGLRPVEELRQNAADIIIDSPMELLEHL